MCAILGNEHEYNGLLPLTANRPLSTLYFDCKSDHGLCTIKCCQCQYQDSLHDLK